MWTCPTCNAQVSDNSFVCPECKTPMGQDVIDDTDDTVDHIPDDTGKQHNIVTLNISLLIKALNLFGLVCFLFSLVLGFYIGYDYDELNISISLSTWLSGTGIMLLFVSMGAIIKLLVSIDSKLN